MISKIKKGANAAGLFKYMFAECDSENRVRETVVDLGGTIPGDSVSEIVQHISQLTSLRPLLAKNAAHLMLRWTQEDDPSILDQKRMAALHAERLGFRHWRAISHGNHIHIGASRVNADGSVVSDSDDYRRGEESRALIEHEFGLVQVAPSHLRNRDASFRHVKAPSQAEMAISATGTGSVRGQLQEAVAAALNGGAVTLATFVHRLNAVGIEVDINISPTTGRISGISFRLDGIAMKGSSLGRSFSWPSLQRRGLSHDIERDLECVQELVGRRAYGEDTSDGREKYGANLRNESSARTNRDPTPTARGGVGKAINRSGGIDEVNAIVDTEPASNLHKHHKRSHEAGRDVADDVVQRHNAGVQSSGEGGELRQGNRSAAPPRSVESGLDRGHSFIRAADDDLPGYSGSNGKSAPAAYESSAGNLEAFDGTETAEEALRKWSRNMARQLRQLQSENGGSSGNRSAIDPFSSLRRIADLANVDIGGDITSQQVVRQVRAFGCDRVEIGVIPPQHRNDLHPYPIRTFTPAELEASKTIKWLKRMNLLDHDIFVRPGVRDDGFVEPMVLVDDLSREMVQRLEGAGLHPAILIESSPRNFQGWVRVSETAISKEVALHAARILARDFSGDPGAAGSCQFGRLSGFTNRKAKYRAEGDRAPFARLRVARIAVAPGAAKLLSEAWASVQREHSRKDIRNAQTRAAIELGGTKYVDNAVSQFLSKRSRCRVTRRDGTLDESAADFAAAVAMIEAGWHVDAISNAIVLASPRLAERHSDVSAYAARTVAAAGASRRLRYQTPSPRPKF